MSPTSVWLLTPQMVPKRCKCLLNKVCFSGTQYTNSVASNNYVLYRAGPWYQTKGSLTRPTYPSWISYSQSPRLRTWTWYKTNRGDAKRNLNHSVWARTNSVALHPTETEPWGVQITPKLLTWEWEVIKEGGLREMPQSGSIWGSWDHKEENRNASCAL